MLNKKKDQEKTIQELKAKIKAANAALSELKLLNEIAIAAGKATDINQTLNIVLNKTIKAVNAEHGAILLISENQKEILKIFIWQNETIKDKNYRINENVTGWVLKNKRTLLIENLSSDERFISTQAEKKSIKSLISAPIWFEGNVIGILQMINKKSNQLFNNTDLTLLSIVTVQAGQLVKNSELQLLNYKMRKEAELALLRAKKAELQTKEMKVEREIEKEKMRTRIAADLHDEIATNLSSIAMFSKIIQEESKKTPPVGKQHSEIIFQLIERISAISQESVNSIRDIIWAIDSKPETIYDLMLRLKDTFVCVCQAKSITFNFDVPPKENLSSADLSPEQRKNIWLILKEAMNNAVKHCSCKTISLSLYVEEKNGNNINIMIRDNGKGFDETSEHKGKGTENMKKRAEIIKAYLTATFCKDKGTTLNLKLKI